MQVYPASASQSHRYRQQSNFAKTGALAQRFEINQKIPTPRRSHRQPVPGSLAQRPAPPRRNNFAAW